MLQLRTICVGIDFSPASDVALESARSLARTFGAKLWLITVIEPPGLYQRILTPLQSRLATTSEVAAAAGLRLKQLIESRESDGISADYQVEVGAPSEELIGAARTCHADLLVVGTGERAVEGLVLGGTAERVLRHSPVPLLVAKRTLPAEPAQILATTDFSDASLPAVLHAVDLARSWRAAVTFLHVIEPLAQAYTWPIEPGNAELYLAEPEELEPEWKALLDRIDLRDLRWERRTCKGYATPAIVSTAAKLSAELIVMGTHGRTGLMHILLGSVAERVTRQAGCSVLTVRPE